MSEQSPVEAGGATIRPARLDDFAAARTIFDKNAGLLPLALASPEEFAAATEAGGVYLASADERVVGILVAVPIAYDGDRPYTLWIETVAVVPAWRRSGIGTALYRALGAWARQIIAHGALAARSNDPATEALHRAVGFTTHRDDLLLWRFEE